MAADEMTITEFRADAFEAINRVVYQGARTVLTRRGKPVAVVVPYDVGELVERLLDLVDLEDALKALDDADKIGQPVEEIFEKLGL